jgi:hypothetical protein
MPKKTTASRRAKNFFAPARFREEDGTHRESKTYLAGGQH